MPPKQKYSKEMIVSKALEIARDKGPDAITARELAACLGCSPQPVFSAFRSMEELMEAVREEAKNVYKKYTAVGEKKERPFRGLGESYIKFAMNEPKLFQFLFMREVEDSKSMEDTLRVIDDDYEKELETIQRFYGISKDAAAELFGHMWLYSHGIATVCATGVCKFTEAEVTKLIVDVFNGIFQKYKYEVEEK